MECEANLVRRVTRFGLRGLRKSESLQRESGVSRLSFFGSELHPSDIGHVQHHASQMSAYLRRIVEDGERWWDKTGWR